MEEVDQQAPAQDAAPKMTKEQRSKVMSEAATRRWAKAKRAKAQAAKAASKPAPKAAVAKKKAQAPREFSSALKTAEKRLAKAILERAEAAAKYAVLSAEIPSLQRIILALKNPLGMVEFPGAPSYGMVSAPTLEQIVGDQPLPYVNPPRRDIPAQPEPVPVIPVPQVLHPANTMGRAGGGAIGVELEETAGEDEDQFLKDSPVAGGQWH
jgi:hypothetical protein